MPKTCLKEWRKHDVFGDSVHRAGELGVTLDGGGVNVELGRDFLGGFLWFTIKGRIVRPFCRPVRFFLLGLIRLAAQELYLGVSACPPEQAGQATSQ